MKAKLAAHSLVTWETTAVHYARRVAQLPSVVTEMAIDLKRCVDEQAISLQIPYHEQQVWEGFVTDLTVPPTTDIRMCVRMDGDKRSVLFQGIPPRKLILNGVKMTAFLAKDVASHSAVLEVLKALVLNIKVAAVAQRNTTDALKIIKSIVRSLKNENFPVRALEGLSPMQRLDMMKVKKGLVNDLEALVNGLSDAIKLASSKMNSDQQVLQILEIYWRSRTTVRDLQ
jgi:hypothetical protein